MVDPSQSISATSISAAVRVNDVFTAMQNTVTAINNLNTTVQTKFSSIPQPTSPGGSSGQVQFNNSGSFGGFTLGGDATLNSSSGTLTIGSNAITYGKIQAVGANKLLGNPTGASTTVTEITVGGGLSFSGSTLIFTSTAAVAAGWYLLNQITASSTWASITDVANSISSAYNTYAITFTNFQPNVAGDLFLQIYQASTLRSCAAYFTAYNITTTTGAQLFSSNQQAAIIVASNVGNLTTYGYSGTLFLQDPLGVNSSNSKKMMFGSGTFLQGGAGTPSLISQSGWYNDNSNPINGIAVAFNSSNIQFGILKIYGIV